MANYFSDRVVEFPGRVTMTPAGAADTYDMARAEGNVVTPGSAFNAATFNGAIDQYGLSYGTCDSAENASTKNVTCPGFTLVTGATIAVKFTNTNTYTGTTWLRVNATNSAAIQLYDEQGFMRYDSSGAWAPYETKIFVYDGNDFVLLDPAYSTKSISPSVYESTGTLNSVSGFLCGRIMHLALSVGNSAAINPGSNIFTGYLDTDYAPKQLTNGVGYYGASMGVLQLLASGNIAVRCIGAQLPANSNIYISATYPI